jgi:DNA-binding PadR family transcriptional regulator
MIKISEFEAAILGLLYEHHHYSYRIVEIMEKRAMQNWADINFSTLPQVLETLEEKKLVKSVLRKKTDDKNREKVFYITEEGYIALKSKIKEILSKKTKSINSFDLGLANINVLSKDEIIKCLENYLSSIDERINSLEFYLEQQEKNNIPYNFIAIYSRALARLKADKKWVKEFMEIIKDKKPFNSKNQ